MMNESRHDRSEGLRRGSSMSIDDVRDLFEASSDQSRLQEAIEDLRGALELTAPGDPQRAAVLLNLGVALQARYARTGAGADLDEAIRLSSEAVAATPEGHSGRAGVLSGLGGALLARFERTASPDDLERAIISFEEAVEQTPLGDADRAAVLSNLGVARMRRFELAGRLEDLDAAIEQARAALDAVPVDHPDRAGMLSNLGAFLQRRFEFEGRLEDLDAAIEQARAALDAVPVDHPDRAGMLSNLGRSLSSRARRAGRSSEALSTLTEAVNVYRELAASDPAVWSPDLGDALTYLSVQLMESGLREEASAAYEEAVEVLRGASAHGNANAAFNLGVLLADAGRPDEAEVAYRQAAETGHVGALNNLGNILADAGRADEAEVAYRQAADAGYADALNNLGNILAATGRADEAEVAYRRAQYAGNLDAARNLRRLSAHGYGTGTDDPGSVSREGAGNVAGRSAAVSTSPVLPVYIAIDESASMAPHVHDLNKGIEALYEALWTNPVLADYVRLAVLGVSDTLTTRAPLSDSWAISRSPQVETGGATAFGPLFQGLLTQISADVARLKSEGAMVHRPVVFLITDGLPTDDWQEPYQLLTDRAVNRFAPDIIVFGIGDVEAATIRQIATRDQFAFIAVPGIGIGTLTARFFRSLTSSILQSAVSFTSGHPQLVVDKPEQFRMASDDDDFV